MQVLLLILGAAINVNNLSISAGSFTNTDRAAISVNNLSIGASYFYNDANIDASEGTILTLNFQNLAGISANALSITVFDDGNSDDTILMVLTIDIRAVCDYLVSILP